ncbi:MAG: CRISPR-associated endonuclease Cas2 [Candidatus Sericytochromatia bacterium]|uniref:CRISPR-associated endoribonuclease Cas2 n=1 Tax=Candidatus Tanganyikabacteria bacterium TaxID=2961651 RepID=A0A937X469_9BACT|nr:CRISPR-associated endonuclease Cas2 [Candidatus Tanganyikabacteria bacterium]
MPLVTVSYDVADDRRRTRVAKLLEDFGTRVQFSVFDCLLDERRFLELRGKLIELIDQEFDSIRFYTLCKRCQAGVDLIGHGPIIEDRDIIVL